MDWVDEADDEHSIAHPYAWLACRACEARTVRLEMEYAIRAVFATAGDAEREKK